MKAIVVREENNKLVCKLEECPVPVCNNTEVLIKIIKTGICGSDFHLFTKNAFSGAKKFPQIIGHEFTGQIVEMGCDVKGFNKFDYIASESVVSCGKCKNCTIIENLNCKNAELIGFTKPGAFAEYICMDYRHIHSIDKLISKYGIEKGINYGTILEPLGCSYKALFLVNKNHDFDNKKIAIFGAGPIGLGAAWILSQKTKGNIFLFDSDENRLNLAKNINCKRINTTLSDSYFENNKEIGPFDFCIECSGVQLDFNKLINNFFNSDSTFIYIARNNQKQLFAFDDIVSNDFTIIGSRGHRGAFNPLIDLICTKDTSGLDLLITNTNFHLNDVPSIVTNPKYSTEGKIIVSIP